MSIDFIYLFFSEETSVLECISNGAVDSTKYVFSIAANLIVYTALLAFSNSLLIWLGSLVGWEGFTLNVCFMAKKLKM